MASQVSICESQLGTRCEHLSDFPMAALCMVLLSATMAATAGTVCEYLFKETYATSIHLQNAQVRYERAPGLGLGLRLRLGLRLALG